MSARYNLHYRYLTPSQQKEIEVPAQPKAKKKEKYEISFCMSCQPYKPFLGLDAAARLEKHYRDEHPREQVAL